MIFDWPKGGATSAYLYDLWTGGSGGRRFAERMVFAVNLLTGDAPNLQVGAVHIPMTSPSGADINFGAAGIFPEINPNNPTSPGRHDGTAVRITDNNSGGGSYGLFASVNQNAKTQNLPIISLPGLAGGVYLGSVLYPVLGGILAATGPDTIVTLAPPRTLPASCVGSTVYFQAFTLSGTPSRAALTNLAGVAYAP
jgi:hypothetical protein